MKLKQLILAVQVHLDGPIADKQQQAVLAWKQQGQDVIRYLLLVL